MVGYSISAHPCHGALAERGSPAVYQATCFRISRMPQYNRPCSSSCIFAWRSIISRIVFSRWLIQELLRSPDNAVTRLKIQGFPLAARPIMTPSQPVSSSSAFAFSGLSTSPFPITGIGYGLFHLADNLPVRCSGIDTAPGVRPWTATAAAPLASGDLRHLHGVDA